MLTNNVPEIEQILTHLELTPHFDSVWNSARMGAEKPNPRAFAGILECYGLKNISYMIGDSVSADLEGALNLGIRCILLKKNDDRASFCLGELKEVVGSLEP